MYEKIAGESHSPELEQPPQEIWRSLVCMNSGIFRQDEGNDPMLSLLITIPSTMPGVGPLYLSLNLDGWGIPPA